MPCGTTISRAREWDEMEPHAVPSHPIPLEPANSIARIAGNAFEGARSTRSTPKTTKPPVGGFVPTAVDPYGPQFASAGTIPVAVTAKVVGVALVNFT
jgi:hypothetical protein